MNWDKINTLYNNPSLVVASDIEEIKAINQQYPYFNLPYFILSRYYFQTKHYRFTDILAKAAARTDNRKWLYEYIHLNEEALLAKENKEQNTITEDIINNETERANEQDNASNIEIPIVENTEIIPIQTPIATEIEESTAVEAKEEIEKEPLTVDDFFQLDEVDTTIDNDSEIKNEDIILPTERNTISIDTQESEIFSSEDTNNTAPIETTETEDKIEKETLTIDDFFNLDGIDTTTENTTENEVIDELPQLHIENDIANSTEEVSQTPATEETHNTNNIEIFEEDENEWNEEELRQIIELRKHPIYSVEAILEKDLSNESEKNFFEWLNNPHQEVKTQDEQEDENDTQEINSINLIEKFIATNPQITRPKREFYNAENMAKKSEQPDWEFVTETLAEIYQQQGNNDMAIKVYEKLSLQNPSKKTYFASLIKKIQKNK